MPDPSTSSNSTSTISAILLAAGTGSRLGSDKNKVFLDLGGSSILARSMSALTRTNLVHEVIIVVRPDEEGEVTRQVNGITGSLPPWVIVPGGAQRWDSVAAGVRKSSGDSSILLIHDAARPFVSPRLLRDVIDAAERTGAAIPGIAVSDTLKQTVSGEGQTTVANTVNRADLYHAQTPQGFRRKLFLDALEEFENAPGDQAHPTDDASIIEQTGGQVTIVPGDRWNFKITTADDLNLAQTLYPLFDAQHGGSESSS